MIRIAAVDIQEENIRYMGGDNVNGVLLDRTSMATLMDTSLSPA